MARSVIVRVFIACSIRAHASYHIVGKLEEFTIFEHLVEKFGVLINQPKGY